MDNRELAAAIWQTNDHIAEIRNTVEMHPSNHPSAFIDRRTYLAGQIASETARHGYDTTPATLNRWAKKVVQTTDALIAELDKPQNKEQSC